METAGATPPGVCRGGAFRDRAERRKFTWLPKHAERPAEFESYLFRCRFSQACLRNWRAA